MNKSWHLNRREALRGLGAIIGLPFLEAMTPLSRAAQKAAKPPVRLMWHWVGTATNMDAWFPVDAGPDYTLSRALKPLERHRQHFTAISGTRNYPELDYGGGREFGHNGALHWLTCQRTITGSGPADLGFSFVLPTTFAGRTFFAQHACVEPVPGGFSFSNGIAFRIR
jgi:hypothetical protein